MVWDGVERRKKMPSDFTPQTAFEGYVVGKLEGITERLNALPCPEVDKRLRKCEQNIENIRGKATIYGAITGFIAGFISKVILGKW